MKMKNLYILIISVLIAIPIFGMSQYKKSDEYYIKISNTLVESEKEKVMANIESCSYSEIMFQGHDLNPNMALLLLNGYEVSNTFVAAFGLKRIRMNNNLLTECQNKGLLLDVSPGKKNDGQAGIIAGAVIFMAFSLFLISDLCNTLKKEISKDYK